MSREVLSPPLQRMGPNRCYRVNLIHEDFGGNPLQQKRPQEQSTSVKSGYMEQDLYAEDDDEIEEDASCTIEELPNSQFKLTMHVAQSFYGGLIGFKGSTKRRIEGETRTEILIPRSREGAGKKDKDENVIIKGLSRSSVCAARRKINLLIQSLRKRTNATHFTAVPLNYGEVRDSFISFKKSILEANMPGIEENLFMPESRIHLTLIVCVLLDDKERSKAVEILQSCRQHLNGLKTPFKVKVSGLEIMNDDPSSVRVLYAKIEAPELQIFGDRLAQTFLDSGLSSEEKQHGRKEIKLHMTLMNIKYLKESNPQAANTFDARNILKQYADFNFGTAECSEIQLCIRGSYAENGFYKTSSTLKF